MSDNLHSSPESALLHALSHLAIHDASPTIRPGMPMFVAFDGPQITPHLSHEEIGVAANTITMAEHTRTHIDAPFHFDPAGLTIDEVDPTRMFMKPYKKFDLTSEQPQPGSLVGSAALRMAAERGGFTLNRGDVALLEMGWDRYWTDDGEHTHDFWGIPILEGLMGLSQVSATGLIVALPLKIAGGSGSPVRVLLLHSRSTG